MNNFLVRLISRHTASMETVRPRLPSRHESLMEEAGTSAAEVRPNIPVDEGTRAPSGGREPERETESYADPPTLEPGGSMKPEHEKAEPAAPVEVPSDREGETLGPSDVKKETDEGAGGPEIAGAPIAIGPPVDASEPEPAHSSEVVRKPEGGGELSHAGEVAPISPKPTAPPAKDNRELRPAEAMIPKEPSPHAPSRPGLPEPEEPATSSVREMDSSGGVKPVPAATPVMPVLPPVEASAPAVPGGADQRVTSSAVVGSSGADVTISIDTIDVRAIMPEPAATPPPVTRRRDPKLSLQDYLKSRDGITS